MAEWHLITGEYPPESGGVSDYTRLVARGLAARGDEVHVWCPAGPSSAERDEGVTVHRELGGLTAADLRRADALLDAYRAPRTVLVQWVPQAFGRRGVNVAFAAWLRRRSREKGDRLWLMVHEAFVRMSLRSWRQSAGSLAQRAMMSLALGAAARVWVSIPAWAGRLRRSTIRSHDYEWLPVPCTMPVRTDPVAAEAMRGRIVPNGGRIVGHFGTYGRHVREALAGLIPRLAPRMTEHDRFLLLGRGGQGFLQELLRSHPELAGRVIATGGLDGAELSAHISACAVMAQPYPDGITSRRTSAMTGIAHGVPTVTTAGYLTEDVWRGAEAVRLVPVGDPNAMAEAVAMLLDDPAARDALGRRGAELYDRRFDLRHTVAALRAARAEQDLERTERT